MSEPKRWTAGGVVASYMSDDQHWRDEFVAAEDYDRLREERDRAVETRENANAATLRVEGERDEARASAAQLAEALREALNTVPPAQNAPMDQWRAYFARMDAARDALAVFDAKEKT